MSLRRSAPSIFHQRLRFSTAAQPSTSSSSSTLIGSVSAFDSNPKKSYLKWISGILGGSGLGFLYWSNSDSEVFKKSSLAFADWSTRLEDRPRARALLRKLSLPELKATFLFFGDGYRRRIFFNYEKRIRLRSQPEKVFEYFASACTSEGELLMRPEDLMRAVVPVFPPSESNLVREGYLPGERNPGELRCTPSDFFMLFDVDNDGYISFKEYIFFVTLLSIPESSFYVNFKMFDTDNSGEIDKEEFKKVMALMRACNRQGSQHRGGLRFGLKANSSVENGGLVEYFFGEDGNAKLQLDKFVRFMRDLQDEMLRLEFAHYDYKKRGTMIAKDFALSMVASAEMRHLSNLLDRVDEMDNNPELKATCVSFQEFKNFAELRKKLQPFSLALFSCGKANGMLSWEDFKRAAFHVCDIDLSDNVVEIIFHVFDSNRDGHLSLDEFVTVLHRHQKDIAQHVDMGIMASV